ncbi:MAG: DUF1569 domain-containing protein [Polyangiaceae bacterium]
MEFRSVADGIRAVEALGATPRAPAGAWDLGQVLHHLAQSVEYSMIGFPVLKPGWFRATVGPLAFSVFRARGRMRHPLDAPIPGAPSVAAGESVHDAAKRLVAALTAFEACSSPLAPHFAYGALGKDAYARAHLMHLADHWHALGD